MNKNKWYFENPITGEFTDDRSLAEWWTWDHIDVNCWKWSNCFNSWGVVMIWEGEPSNVPSFL